MNTQNLRQFRQLCRIYFGKKAHHLLPLLDALASNNTAQTVPVLSLHPLHPHQYRTLYYTIHRFQPQPHTLYSLLQPAIPQDQTLYAFGVDTTPYPRPYARTLADCTFVLQPTPIQGNKPVTIGHEYSIVCLLQQRHPKQPVWTLPLHACIDRRHGLQVFGDIGNTCNPHHYTSRRLICATCCQQKNTAYSPS